MPIVPFAFKPSESKPAFNRFPDSRKLTKSYNSLLPMAVLIYKISPVYKSLLIGNGRPLGAERLISISNLAHIAFCTNWQQSEALSTTERERILQLARVMKLGKEIFGEVRSFISWLRKPAYGLAGKLPIDLCHSSSGIDLVTDELTRIAYGDLA